MDTNLLDGMMFGLLGVVVGIAATFLLPETAGRQFAVVEGKERVQEDAPLARAIPLTTT